MRLRHIDTGTEGEFIKVIIWPHNNARCFLVRVTEAGHIKAQIDTPEYRYRYGRIGMRIKTRNYEEQAYEANQFGVVAFPAEQWERI